jgi:hypothetical protein
LPSLVLSLAYRSVARSAFIITAHVEAKGATGSNARQESRYA